MCDHLKIDHTTMIKENISHLLAMWLIKDYKMDKFPWYITPCQSQSDFFSDNLETLTICVLRHRSDLLDNFVALIPGETISSMIEVIISIYTFFFSVNRTN